MQLTYFPLEKGPLSGVGTQGGWAITSYFGGRIDPLTGRAGSHGGQDLAFAGCSGKKIIAPCDGYVSQAWDSSGGGNWTSLTASDGSYFGFGHASRFEPGVNNTRVKAGQVLAYVGTTGGSTGAHLHFAYRAPGSYSYSDPFNLLEAVKNKFPGAVEIPDPKPLPTPKPPTKKEAMSAIYRFPRGDALYQLCTGYLVDALKDDANGTPQPVTVNKVVDYFRAVPDPATIDQLVADGTLEAGKVRVLAAGDDALDIFWARTYKVH